MLKCNFSIIIVLRLKIFCLYKNEELFLKQTVVFATKEMVVYGIALPTIITLPVAVFGFTFNTNNTLNR